MHLVSLERAAPPILMTVKEPVVLETVHVWIELASLSVSAILATVAPSVRKLKQQKSQKAEVHR